MTFIIDLERRLRERLNNIEDDGDPIKSCDRRIELIETAIKEMKDYVIKNPFPGRTDEINYLKFHCPIFYKLYIYYLSINNLAVRRTIYDSAHLLTYLEDEKQRVMLHFKENEELYQYYRSGRTDEDEKYFTFKPPSRTIDFLKTDNTFCRACLVIAELSANEEYRKILDHEIERLKCPSLMSRRIEIKASKSDIVELVAPIYEMGIIWLDGRPISLAELIRLIGEGLGVDLKDFSVLDNANRNRKKSVHPFLDQIQQVMISRRGRLDRYQ